MKRIYISSLGFLLPLSFIYIAEVFVAAVFVKPGWQVQVFCLGTAAIILFYHRGTALQLSRYLAHVYKQPKLPLRNRFILYGVLPIWAMLAVAFTFSLVKSLVWRVLE